MSILSARDLSIGYDGRTILSNIDFKIHSGDYFCIVGENGSGKSTLMKTILGLQPAISGEIVFGDGLNKSQIGYLPQQTDLQKDFPASVYEIVLSGCQSHLGKHFFYSKAQKKTALMNMEKMGISHLKNRCFRELSGGQKQRVLLSRALCATTRVLLLDEPVAGLDPTMTADMYQLIKELNDDGMTIIMISHDIANISIYANRIFDINKAEIKTITTGGTCYVG
ncbi:MAG: ABC transporter ATP-binding protein [Lachnospiraceae bacterium]|nr:ABC transporter ATP-binding protein [Lachnospiraceae bacterium]